MTVDLSHIPARHDAINKRLEEWSSWVKVRPAGWVTAPMFRLYRAPKQWESDLQVRIEINTLDASEIERAVSFLPPSHRTALRWAYVFQYIPVNAMRQEFGVTRDGLAGLIHDGRVMLINRLRERLIEK